MSSPGRAAAGVVLERIPYDPVWWGRIVDSRPDTEVFHSPAWLAYLAETQRAEPVIASVISDGQGVGYFVGAIVRRYGLRILGSPLRGWVTLNMGFILDGGIERRAAADALLPFAFHDLGVAHLELSDRGLTGTEMSGSAYELLEGDTYRVHLDGSAEEVFSRFNSTNRNLVRRAARVGLRAEVATNAGFADEFYAQTQDVFIRQGLVPTYGVERVRALIRHVQPSGQLLMVRVSGPDGSSVATCLSVGRNATAALWGAAFLRDEKSLQPNQLLHWETMRTWKERGATCYDMGGGGEYKAKYGAVLEPHLNVHQSRHPVLRLGRETVRIAFALRQSVAGRWARARAADAGQLES